MKVPRDASENRSQIRKAHHKTNSCSDGKILEEKKELSGMKQEEGDLSTSCIEPSTTALIPPWLRNTFGLAEKDTKPNQKCMKIFCASNDPLPSSEIGESKTDSNSDCLKCHFYVQDSPSTNPILEVNIGSEADFMKDSTENLPSQWRPKSSRHGQYDLFGMVRDRELSRSVKSEVTSIDVVVPTEDQEDEKRQLRRHKGKWRTRRSTSNGYYRSEDNLKIEGDTVFRSAERDLIDDLPNTEPLSTAKSLDGRLLLLCGKKAIDNLTQEDVALLQEMKNQIGHKEGFEKLFSEIRESAFTEKETRKTERKEEKESRKEIKATYLLGKIGESKATSKNKSVDEERKHCEKKSRSQQKHMKYMDEPEVEKEKKAEKWKAFGQRMRVTHAEREKKTKLRHSDYAIVEKVVTEMLQKFIDLYRVQVPPDMITSMKTNIIQNLQSEYLEANGTKRSFDADVQNQISNIEGMNCAVNYLLTEDQQNGYKTGNVEVNRISFPSEENVVSKDIPAEEMSPKTKADIEKAETLNTLRKDFEKCLELIQHQLDVTGTRLCSIVMEKNGTEDMKLRIVHNFSNGLTETAKVYDRSNLGSPEGDNAYMGVCDCQHSFKKRAQWTQTKEKTYGNFGTQTDWVDVSVRHFRNADLTPGLYRITKATESGRFYLTPEILDDDGLEEERKVKRAASDMCVKSVNELFKDELLKYLSRETFCSERWSSVPENKTLWRAFKSDCLELNNTKYCVMTKALTDITGGDFRKGMRGQEGTGLVQIELERGMGMNDSRDFLTDSRKSEVTPEENSSYPEGYHRECVWLWNGKKISPGIDLKVHVENLVREKLNEILYDSKVTESKNNCAVNSVGEMTTKNLEIRKTAAKFCITNHEVPFTDSAPFIFSASDQQLANFKEEVNESSPRKIGPENYAFPPVPASEWEESKSGKSVREVGTQNSQHAIVSLNIGKLKPRSKLCTVAKFNKRRQSNCQRLRRANSKYTETIRPFAESVSEAKKVKLEFRKESELGSNREKGSERTSDSVRECFSIISNGSSTSNEGPVRVKLIGIEVSKEKPPGDGDFCSAKSSETKGFIVEGFPMAKEDERKFKYWEIIENVLNRVNQKEKDFLWNDIREFVKKKIGRDINDEGAREVCIEIEQDVPKFAKGKASRMVVARGNYTRNEGDVEVEVDLTLDDLERILRHRQKKMRRRIHTPSQKTESKESATSSSDTITEYHTFNCRPFLNEDIVSNSEVKMIKEQN